MANFYIFYDPRNNNKIMGESTEKKAMEFPYIKANKWMKNLQNLEIKFKDDKPYIHVNNDYKYKKKHN